MRRFASIAGHGLAVVLAVHHGMRVLEYRGDVTRA